MCLFHSLYVQTHFSAAVKRKTPNKQIYIFPSSDLILWYHCWLQYCYLKYTVYHKTEDCRSTVVDRSKSSMQMQKVQCSNVSCDLPHDNSFTANRSATVVDAGADPEIFQRGGGGLRRKILKEKCLLIHLSTRVHINTRQTCNSFPLFLFQEDCLLIFALFYYSLFMKFERGVATPVSPPTTRTANGMSIVPGADPISRYLWLARKPSLLN